MARPEGQRTKTYAMQEVRQPEGNYHMLSFIQDLNGRYRIAGLWFATDSNDGVCSYCRRLFKAGESSHQHLLKGKEVKQALHNYKKDMCAIYDFTGQPRQRRQPQQRRRRVPL